MGLIALFCALAALIPGYADLRFRRGDSAGIASALRLAPLNADYLAQWSLVTVDRNQSVESLRRAVASNPYYSWAWIQLALTSPDANSSEAAERDLLKAASVDRGFAPRWALANYYYGRGAASQSFWYWTREALASLDPGRDDASALTAIRLAWRMSPDAATLLSRAIPSTPRSRHQFLKFLMSEHPLEAPFATVSGLLSTAVPDDVPALDSWTTALRNAGDAASSTALWNRLCSQHLLPFPPLGADPNNLLTNAAFSTPPSGRTFDWRLFPTTGIEPLADPPPAGFSFTLSGDQPERWRLLSQTVPVQPGATYVLSYRMQPDIRSGADGLLWRAVEGSGTEKLLAAGAAASTLQFTPTGPFVTVALDYARPRGETPLRGSVRVDSLRLRQLSPPQVTPR